MHYLTRAADCEALPISDQFADPSLRRFNLVAVDLLCHGDTTGLVPNDYDQKMAAADIVAFMVSPLLWQPG